MFQHTSSLLFSSVLTFAILQNTTTIPTPPTEIRAFDENRTPLSRHIFINENTLTASELLAEMMRQARTSSMQMGWFKCNFMLIYSKVSIYSNLRCL